MKKQLSSFLKRTCLLLALVCWLVPNSWASPVDVTWDGKTTDCLFPSGTAETPASSVKEGITLTTNCPAAGAYVANRNPQCYSYESAPAQNYIDITTDGKMLTNVDVSIVYIGGSGSNSVLISFSSGATFDGEALVGTTNPQIITGTNDQQGDVTCEFAAPYGAYSARIYRTNTGWGPYLHRIRVAATDACTTGTATFANGGATSGEVPADVLACENSEFNLPGANTLAWPMHKFVGWSDDTNTYAAGAAYTMPVGGVSFTAVWEELIVPAVANLAMVNPMNSNIPLKWDIIGICDMSNPVEPIAMLTGTTSSMEYTSEGNFVTAIGTMPKYEQFGVGFNIPATTGMEWVSFDYDGTIASAYGDAIWGGVCDASHAYWHFEDPMTLVPNGSWQNTGEWVLDQIFWDEGAISGALTQSVSQVAVYVNTSKDGGSAGTLKVRNVRYHVAGTLDVDHVVLLRKEGSASTNITDGDVLYTGTLSNYTDDAAKTLGTTYYYTIFAVDANGNVSAATTISKTITDDTPRYVTYAKGGDAVTGSVPTDANIYILGNEVTLLAPSDLVWAGHRFAGWSDGANIYAAGASYTMPNEDVTFTAQWEVVYGVTYAKGGEAVTGSVPTDANVYAAGEAVTLAALGDLEWTGHGFLGWNDGMNTYAAGAAYTMPAKNVNFTAQWRDLEDPILVPTVTRLDVTNYHEIPGTYSFDVDGTGASTCIDIKDQHYAEWLVKFTPGIYNATLTYGTTGWAVNVTFKIYDGDAEVVLDPIPSADIHSDGSGAHIYQRTWGLDLSNLDPDKAYKVRVIDTYSSTGSNPKVGYLDFAQVLPTAITNTDDTRLDYTNATFSPGVVSYDMKDDGNSTMCLDLKDQAQVDWYVTITPDIYNISMLYGKLSGGVRVKFTILDPDDMDNPVFDPAIMEKWESKWYEEKTWSNIDLTGVTPNKQYIVRVKDAFGSNGSKPKVDNVTFSRIVPVQIENETTLDVTNTVSTPAMATDLDIDNDGNNDNLMNLNNSQADWYVTIAKGVYNVSLLYGAPAWSIRVAVKLIDPFGVEPDRVLSVDGSHDYYYISGNGTTVQRHTGTTLCDLTGVTSGKVYKVQIVDAYPGCDLRVKNLVFAPVAPVAVPAETRLDASNTISTVSLKTDLDIDDDGNNDNLMNLYNTHADWWVTITPDIYNISLLYGAPEYSIKVAVSLIDPLGVEPVRHLSVDGTHNYYSFSGDENEPQHATGITKCNLLDLTPNKKYILRVEDVYTKCNLRVSHVAFSQASAIEIPAETRLDVTNTISTPSMATDLDIDNDGINDNLMNLYNTNAEWMVQITPNIYDVTLVYGAPAYSIKVAVKLIDPLGVEADRFLSANPYYYVSGNGTTVQRHSETTVCDLTNLTPGKIYKVQIADVYPKCNLRVSHLSFARHIGHYTREGLHVGDWGTVCIPFAVEAANISGADLYQIDAWAADGTSLTLAALDPTDDMVAGRPYIFQATATTLSLDYFEEGGHADAGEYNGLIGSYSKEPIAANNDNYIIYGNKLYEVNSDNAFVGANRAYIHKQAAVQPAPGNRRRITLMVDGAQVVTGMDNVQGEEMQSVKVIRDGQLFIIRDGKTYNAQGQLVIK